MLVITEKPSVAIKIREIITPPPNTFSLRGHLLELDFPKEYNHWKSIDPKILFEAPIIWTIRDYKTYELLEKALRKTNKIIIATDNDPEGELIGYEILLIAKKIFGDFPIFKRMRFNTITPSELIESWSRLESDLKWGWVWKALFRHKFDLITGAAYTRLLTLSKKFGNNNLISWGSCQSPTLWFVYQREMEIRNFKSEKYWVISALININGIEVKVSTTPIRDQSLAQKLYLNAKNAKYAIVEDFELKDEIINKPLPTDTDSMLQELTKLYGISGVKIMSIVEDLYAEGFISYPRTETNVWVNVNHEEILKLLLKTPLKKFIIIKNYNPRSGRKNDNAHPPIHPTNYYSASDLKGRIWEYIARRYLANVVGQDAKLKKWNLKVKLNEVLMDASNKYFINKGFFEIFPYFEPKELLYIPRLEKGQKIPIINVKLEERKTKPPSRLTEAELLRLLEANSIGTDATRADYPNIIVERGYVIKKMKRFYLCKIGEELIKILEGIDKRLVTPETRRYVESLMTEVESGKLSIEEALKKSLEIYKGLYEKLAKALLY
ncbi:MAG: DNA topoisomerase [Candidatus Methanomethylicaceae archaeon]|nr:DNA topoisomerase [Candidatus Verstraetearchaeota archaeon]